MEECVSIGSDARTENCCLPLSFGRDCTLSGSAYRAELNGSSDYNCRIIGKATTTSVYRDGDVMADRPVQSPEKIQNAKSYQNHSPYLPGKV